MRPDHREQDPKDVRRPGPDRYRPAPPAPRQSLAGGVPGLFDRDRVAPRSHPGPAPERDHAAAGPRGLRRPDAIRFPSARLLHLRQPRRDGRGNALHPEVRPGDRAGLHQFPEAPRREIFAAEGSGREHPRLLLRRSGGHVFSDKYGPKELKQIRNRIRSEFYNVPQLLRIAAKARRIGLVTGRDIAGIALKLPLILGQWIEGRLEKKRRKAPGRPRAAARRRRANANPCGGRG